MPNHKKQTADSHWFASSCLHWEVGYDLTDVLRKLRERNRRSVKLKAGDPEVDVVIWRVPLPLDTPYKIRNFNPDVEGAESLGHSDIREEH